MKCFFKKKIFPETAKNKTAQQRGHFKAFSLTTLGNNQ